MNTSFLQALQSKSKAITESRKTEIRKASDAPEYGKVYALTGNGNNNVASGASWKDSEVKPEAPKDPVMLSVVDAAISDNQTVVANIEYVMNKNRFDITFTGAPSRDIRAELKNMGFWYDPTTTIWTHSDNEETRVFLNRVFDAGLDIKPEQAAIPAFGAEEREEYIAERESVSEEAPKPAYLADITTEDFCQYRERVDLLCKELSIDMGTLQLRAIEALYNLTFGN